MTIVKASTKRGRDLLYTAKCNIGYTLDDVYASASAEKYRAYNYCKELFARDEDASDFHICSKNTYAFTVAWVAGDGNIRIETSRNSYLVDMSK